VQRDSEIKTHLAAERPYGKWLAAHREQGDVGQPGAGGRGDLLRRQALFGYTREELTKVLRPIGASGSEPISSMGDDTAVPPLAQLARPLYSFFRQRFAQVTNPAIDPLRERCVMSPTTLLGGRLPIANSHSEAAHGIELASFCLYPSGLDALRPVRLDATFTEEETLERACLRLAEEAETLVGLGDELLVVSDRAAGGERAPIPALLAIGVVHHHLVARGLRARTTLLVESDEPREVHHYACLLGYGAEAICAPLALETVARLAADDKLGGDRPSPEEAQGRFHKAIENGVLKVMSKMGISDVASYCGAQLFEILGLADEVVERAFLGTPSRIGGLGWNELQSEALARLAESNAAKAQLANPGYIKFRKGGEAHATTPEVVDALHALTAKRELAAAHSLRVAVSREDREAYEKFASLIDERAPLELRDLLEFAPTGPPLPLDEVEPAEAIARRFSSGGMSHGSLSAEAHEAIALAFNTIGARSNCGEGGEDLARAARGSASKIRQIASGRFGVNASYAAHAEELQIKIAQGSKPGEGGQLPGFKVTPEIARLRHTSPGVSLISPPPHHDIYSIEDLAQLIFDLRQVSPSADVSVKLVAEAGVGLVAAGVAKALASIIHIAGADGGTGASPLSSIKNAGAPWELGLVETQHALIDNDLRSRVRLRVDGGIRTGRDVVIAALLGADEVSFGTVLLIAEGCMMVRSCHVDTCPVGIATQRPELRAKFAGTPEMVISYVMSVAEDVRRHLAALGLASFDEAVGRTDLLRRGARGRDNPRTELVDLSALLAAPRATPTRYDGVPVPESGDVELGRSLLMATPEPLEITNRDRAVGAYLAGELARRDGPSVLRRFRFRGSAGQSFGAFLSEGIQLELDGEANDYVGKSMSGGRIVISPPANDAGDPALVGNTVLYGATGGELYCAGAAGERFGVRNSGAIAVVEGVGSHGCEYMTGGLVVVLGPVGRNFAAGMTGGVAVVHDPHTLLARQLNHELVEIAPLDAETAERVRRTMDAHARFTGSARATALLDSWDAALEHLAVVRPRADVAAVEAAPDLAEEKSA
jgi:glutamate synthase (ferredoxin)